MKLKDLFDAMDLDGNGLLNPTDLRASIMNFTNFNAQKQTIYHIIGHYDK